MTDQTGPWATKPAGVPCDFVDGDTAARHEAYVDLRQDEGLLRLTYRSADGDLRHLDWPLPHLRTVDGQTKLRDGPTQFAVLTNIMSPHARLYLRDPALLIAINAQAPNLAKRPPVTGRGRIAGLIAGAVASVALIVFVLIPLISNQLSLLLPAEGERALGDKTYAQVRDLFSEGLLPIEECTDDKGLAALEVMTNTLLDASTLQRGDVRFSVLDLDMINAFALPGGRVVIMRGMIDAADAPEELAAVIGHEIGHVAHRDPTRHALRSVGTFGVLSLIFGDFAGGSLVLMGVNQLVNAQYSQEAENAADVYAHEMLPKAGVSPGALAPLFERLKEEYGDTEGMMSHLASHPKLGDRVDRAKAAAEGYEGDGAPILRASEWYHLRRVCE